MKKRKLLFNDLSIPKLYELHERFKDNENPNEREVLNALPDDKEQLLKILQSAGAALSVIEDDDAMTSHYFIFSQLTYIFARFKLTMFDFQPDAFLLECISNHAVLFNEYFKMLIRSGDVKEPVPDPPIEFEYYLTPIGTEILSLYNKFDEYISKQLELESNKLSSSSKDGESTPPLDQVDVSNSKEELLAQDDDSGIESDFNESEDQESNENVLELNLARLHFNKEESAQNEDTNETPVHERISRSYADVLRHHEKSKDYHKPLCQVLTPLKCERDHRASSASFDKKSPRKRVRRATYKRIINKVIDDDGFITLEKRYVEVNHPRRYDSRPIRLKKR